MFDNSSLLLLVLAIWSLPWKAWSMWRAAQRREKGWFVALLIINTLGILELLYIFVLSRQPKKLSVSVPPMTEGLINYDSFAKMDLRTATILRAEKVSGSDKLIRLDVDLGGTMRQIVAGIGTQYDPNSLVGKNIVVLANLEPKTLMGLKSQGMLLAAQDQNGLAVLTPDKDISSGSKIS